jgi:hypothetical protein
LKISVPKKFFLLSLSLLLFTSAGYSQLGGRYSYAFLQEAVSARLAALGGNQASINDKDVNVGFVNPSLITPGLHNNLALNYVNYFSGVNYGSVQYARTFNKVGNFMGSLQFMDYGTFDYADESGNLSGTFGASDFALTVGWGRQLDSLFSIGAAAKLIYAFYEGYTSFGFAVDVAGTYQSKSGWSMSLIARNLGMQLTTMTPGTRDPLPFTLQYAVSKRLKHVPFLFSFVYDHIEKWDLTYTDPNNPSGGVDPITGEPQEKEGFSKIADQFMRHIIIGGEIYIGKNIVLRGGYNYRRRQEMKINERPGMVGFSWGIGVRVYKFKINYARSTYHQAGSPNYLSLTFDINSFTNDEVVRF